MTKGQIEQLEEFAFELRNNRDCYSRAKIIEMMVDKVKILNKPAVIIALPEFGLVEMATWDYFTTQGQHGEITNEEHYHIVMEYLKNNIAYIQGRKGNEL